jgi:hypothetical protein
VPQLFCRGSTPSHRGLSDDVWKPGGSIDRNHENGDDNMTDVGSGWSVAHDNTSQVQNNSFVDSNATTGGKHDVLRIFFYNTITACRTLYFLVALLLSLGVGGCATCR